VLDVADRRVAAEVTARFEVDPSIALLLRDCEEVTRDDLAALVTSELAGLADLLGYETAEAFLGMDEPSRERLRAKLSLLLQAKGLRCTGVSAFREVAVDEEAEEQPAAEIAPAAAAKTEEEAVAAAMAAQDRRPQPAEAMRRADEGTEAPVSAAELEPALAEAIGQVKTDTDWEDLLGEWEAGGLEVDQQAAEALDELGEQVVDRQVDAAGAARRIREMAEQAARRAGVSRPDLRRWQGLALRLRLMDVSPEEAAEAPTASGTATSVPAGFRQTRRPWTWWMIRRRSIDERLQRFLKESVGHTRLLLEQHRKRLKAIRPAGQVKELGDQVRLVEDLLATVPTLVPAQRKLRPDRKRIKELLKSVERAATSAEMVQAQAKALVQADPGSEPWENALADTSAAVDVLAAHLRARREVR